MIRQIFQYIQTQPHNVLGVLIEKLFLRRKIITKLKETLNIDILQKLFDLSVILAPVNISFLKMEKFLEHRVHIFLHLHIPNEPDQFTN